MAKRRSWFAQLLAALFKPSKATKRATAYKFGKRGR